MWCTPGGAGCADKRWIRGVYASTWVTRPGSPEDTWMVVRGVTNVAFDVYDRVKIVRGQRPQPGGGVIVGRMVPAKLGTVEVGAKLRFGTREWTVVGIFDAGGTVYDSEIWADLNDLSADLKREGLSLITIKVEDPEKVDQVVYELNTQSQVIVFAEPEVRYYSDLAKQFDQLGVLGLLIAMIMAVAAIFGGMNTMFAAVAARVREVGVLKALGFSHTSIMASFVLESLIIALAGGIIGCALGAGIHGLSASAPTFAFTLTVTERILMEGMGLSVLIGALGGWWPARSAARLRVIEAVRHL